MKNLLIFIPEIVIFLVPVLLSGLVSGVVVAVLNYVLTRSKTQAETRKILAETDKFLLETQKIRKELTSSTESITAATSEISVVAATASYQLSGGTERVVYETKNRDIGYDFKGVEQKIFKRIDGKDVAVSPRGLGTLSFDKGVLNVQRTNTEGRYDIWLRTYCFDNEEKQVIPQDDLIDRQRKMRISCEVKTIGGEHSLKFVFRGEKSGAWLAQEEVRVSEEQWTFITNYFLVSAKEDCVLRIQDQSVSHAPSSIQIRNLTLAEKM